MPTYEFRCSNGHVFDQFHKISDAPSTAPCPECGAMAERAISGGAGLVFKGSGFYLTDYGKNAHRSSAPPAKSEGGDGGGKSEAKSETKSETKSDAKSDAKPAGGSSSSSSSGGNAGGSSGGASGGSSGGSSGGTSGAGGG